MNPEAVIWLAVVVFGSIYVPNIVIAWIEEHRDRKRAGRTLNRRVKIRPNGQAYVETEVLVKSMLDRAAQRN